MSPSGLGVVTVLIVLDEETRGPGAALDVEPSAHCTWVPPAYPRTQVRTDNPISAPTEWPFRDRSGRPDRIRDQHTQPSPSIGRAAIWLPRFWQWPARHVKARASQQLLPVHQ